MIVATVMCVSLFAAVFARPTSVIQEQARETIALLGFSPDDLCVDSDGSGSSHAAYCGFCMLPTALAEPGQPDCFGDLYLPRFSSVIVPQARQVVRQARDPTRSLRGPPFAFVITA